jgi:dTDP-4-amino-4,6-dideoxygalactose transaminase
MMKAEIGGDIELPLNHLLRPRLHQYLGFSQGYEKFKLMSNGRASIRFILRECLKLNKGDEVLLPSYIFQNLQNPFKELGLNIRFYKLKNDLSMDLEDVRVKLTGQTKVFYILDYFGFPQPVEKLGDLKKRYPGCAIIDDITQSYLTSLMNPNFGRIGDYTYFVLMKYVPTPDGAMLLFKKNPGGVTNWRNRQYKHFVYWFTRYAAMNCKTIFLRTHLLPRSLHLNLFNSAARLIEDYPLYSTMSLISRTLIDTFDFQGIIAKRRQNYMRLLNNWNDKWPVPMHRNLPDDVCPMGFITLSEKRQIYRKELSKAGIYCPVHWQPVTTIKNDGNLLATEIDKMEFAQSWEISNNIMFIPIDQRYGIKEMDYILNNMGRVAKLIGQ